MRGLVYRFYYMVLFHSQMLCYVIKENTVQSLFNFIFGVQRPSYKSIVYNFTTLSYTKMAMTFSYNSFVNCHGNSSFFLKPQNDSVISKSVL